MSENSTVIAHRETSMKPMMNTMASMLASGQYAVGRFVLAAWVALMLCLSPVVVAQAATIEQLQLLSDESGEN